MSKDILSEYGRGTSQPQRAPAYCGGVLPGEQKEIPYSPPVGPKGIMEPQAPGLHGSNHGNDQRQNNGGAHTGSPGIGGTNHGNGGSQGRY